MQENKSIKISEKYSQGLTAAGLNKIISYTLKSDFILSHDINVSNKIYIEIKFNKDDHSVLHK